MSVASLSSMFYYFGVPFSVKLYLSLFVALFDPLFDITHVPS